MSESVPVAAWGATLSAALGGRWSVRCVAVCDSTQEEARGASPGSVVVAGRQCAGRGRLGRRWSDTGDDGVAMTAVVAVDEPARLSVAAGLAIAFALRDVLDGDGSRVGLKWPNDVHTDGRKVAGVLVEIVDGAALIGIGINVCQRDWPAELAAVAISLAQAGACVERLEVMRHTLERLHTTLGWSTARLREEFMRCDVLRGTPRRFRVGAAMHEGTVESIDPFTSIRLRRDDGQMVELATAHAQLA